MDGQTDRLTDKSDFIERCRTNVERPKGKIHFEKNGGQQYPNFA